MDKEFVVECLNVLYQTESKIIVGNFCYKIFISLDKLSPSINSHYTEDMKNMVERIYFGYSNYGEMKRDELIYLFESHLRVMEEIQIINMMENISLK